jgi:hypothetical protein
MSEELLIDFSKGGTFYMPVGPVAYKCHILEVIECNMVVFKWFGTHKPWWHYEVKDAGYIEAMHKIYLEREAK